MLDHVEVGRFFHQGKIIRRFHGLRRSSSLNTVALITVTPGRKIAVKCAIGGCRVIMKTPCW